MFCSLRNTDLWWYFTRIRANQNARSLVCNWVQATKFVSASEQTTIIVPHTKHGPQHKATALLSEVLFIEHKNCKGETGQKICSQYSAQLPTEPMAIPSFTSAKNSVLQPRILAHRTSTKPNKQTKRPKKLDCSRLIFSDAKHFTEIPIELCKCSPFITLHQYLRHFSTWEHLVQHSLDSVALPWKLFHCPQL